MKNTTSPERFAYIAVAPKGHVKVGCSINPSQRIKDMRRFGRLTLLHQLPGGFRTERGIQCLLSPWRVHGIWEWFYDPQLSFRSAIETIANREDVQRFGASLAYSKREIYSEFFEDVDEDEFNASLVSGDIAKFAERLESIECRRRIEKESTKELRKARGRQRQVSIRATDAQMDELWERSEACGLSFSEYLTSIVFPIEQGAR